jgi:hypothetical protein
LTPKKADCIFRVKIRRNKGSVSMFNDDKTPDVVGDFLRGADEAGKHKQGPVRQQKQQNQHDGRCEELEEIKRRQQQEQQPQI